MKTIMLGDMHIQIDTNDGCIRLARFSLKTTIGNIGVDVIKKKVYEIR